MHVLSCDCDPIKVEPVDLMSPTSKGLWIRVWMEIFLWVVGAILLTLLKL